MPFIEYWYFRKVPFVKCYFAKMIKVMELHFFRESVLLSDAFDKVRTKPCCEKNSKKKERSTFSEKGVSIFFSHNLWGLLWPPRQDIIVIKTGEVAILQPNTTSHFLGTYFIHSFWCAFFALDGVFMTYWISITSSCISNSEFSFYSFFLKECESGRKWRTLVCQAS